MISTTTVGNTQGRKYQLLNGQAKVEVGFVLVSTKGAHSWSKLLSEFLFFNFFCGGEGGGGGGGGGVRDPPTQSAEALRVVCLQNGIFSHLLLRLKPSCLRYRLLILRKKPRNEAS